MTLPRATLTRVSSRRNAKWKSQRVVGTPLDFHDAHLGDRVDAEIDPRQAHCLAMGRVGIGGVMCLWPDDLFEDQHVTG
jgi:hypothetical protein